MTTDRRSEAGVTLIEVVVTVMIMGVAFVAILAGMGTTFTLSGLHREQARTESEIRRYAEAVKAAPYAACSYSTGTAGLTFTVGSGYSITEPIVTGYIDETTGTFTPYTAGSPCTPTTTRAQVVMVSVTSTRDTRAVETLDVVKRPS
jgi:type II secretory pathway pseudopilin PulG